MASKPIPPTISDARAKQIQSEEIKRQTAPEKRCGRVIAVGKDGVPVTCPQVVKIGTLCPACGVKVL